MKYDLQKIYTISILSIIILVQFNCSKKNNSDIINKTSDLNCKVISLRDSAIGGNFWDIHYFYLNDGRINNLYTSGNDSSSYIYLNSTTIYRKNVVSSDTLFLNNNGLVYEKTDGSITTNYYYNENQFLVQENKHSNFSQDLNNYIIDYTWSNGNLTGEHAYTVGPSQGSGDNGTFKITYSNLINKSNLLLIQAGENIISTGLFGKNSINYPLSVQDISDSNGYSFSYSFDENNLPKKISIITFSGIFQASYNSFIFSCK